MCEIDMRDNDTIDAAEFMDKLEQFKQMRAERTAYAVRCGGACGACATRNTVSPGSFVRWREGTVCCRCCGGTWTRVTFGHFSRQL